MSRQTPEKIQALRQVKQHRRHVCRLDPLFTVALVIAWMAVFGHLSWVTFLGGLLVSILVQVLFPLPHQRGTWRIRPLRFLYLVVRFIWDLIAAGIHVGILVLFPRPHENAILRCETRTSNPVYLTILAAMVSLVPGTIVVEVDRKRRRMYLHCLDVAGQGGIDGIKRATAAQEERILWAVAPREVLVEAGLAGAGLAGGAGTGKRADRNG